MSRLVEITKVGDNYTVNPNASISEPHTARLITSLGGSTGRTLAEITSLDFDEDSELEFETFTTTSGTVGWKIVGTPTGMFSGVTSSDVTIYGLISVFRGSAIISENSGYGLDDDLSRISGLSLSEIYNIQYSKVIVYVNGDSIEFPCGLLMNPLQPE